MIFNDKYKHEIPYAMDYPFASDFYDKQDVRYILTELYKSSVKNKTGITPYNCKIFIPSINTGKRFYNVLLYFWDIRKLNSCEQFPKDSSINFAERDFTVLFKDALKQCSLKQLDDMKLNPNGVFVEDFRIRSLAYTISQAEHELKKLWTSRYPQIVLTTGWSSSMYLFFNTMNALNQFVENDIVVFAEYSHAVLKKYDKDGFCSIKTFTCILDLLENYNRIGGRNYFNSDAMDGLQTIYI